MVRVKILILFLLFLPISIYAEEVEFYKCVDGDTFKAKRNDEIITIRLLAVDTPESVSTKVDTEYLGPESSKYTCDLLTNAKKIELEYDENSNKTDKYNRVLAWVFVDDELLQDNLIKNGYAEVAYLYGDYKYTALLQDHEAVAKIEKVGIWSSDNTDTTEDSDVEKTTKVDDTEEVENKLENEEYDLLTIIVMIIAVFLYLQKKLKRVK